jgi:peroxiredoxin
LAAIQAQNAEVWAVSPDEPEALAKLAKKEGLTMPLLVDKDLAVIKAFGILNQNSPTVPHPTVVVVDPHGVIRFFHLDEDYTRRPPAKTILEAVQALAPAS